MFSFCLWFLPLYCWIALFGRKLFLVLNWNLIAICSHWFIACIFHIQLWECLKTLFLFIRNICSFLLASKPLTKRWREGVSLRFKNLLSHFSLGTGFGFRPWVVKTHISCMFGWVARIWIWNRIWKISSCREEGSLASVFSSQ